MHPTSQKMVNGAPKQPNSMGYPNTTMRSTQQPQITMGTTAQICSNSFNRGLRCR